MKKQGMEDGCIRTCAVLICLIAFICAFCLSTIETFVYVFIFDHQDVGVMDWLFSGSPLNDWLAYWKWTPGFVLLVLKLSLYGIGILFGLLLLFSKSNKEE